MYCEHCIREIKFNRERVISIKIIIICDIFIHKLKLNIDVE